MMSSPCGTMMECDLTTAADSLVDRRVEYRRLVEHVAVSGRDDGRRRGRSRIATRPAVHVDDELHYAADSGGKSPVTRERRRSRTSR